MKMKLILGLIFAAATALVANGQIVNGSFEQGAADPGVYLTVYAPNNTAITGWTVDFGSVDYIGTYWQASNGNRSIDMSGLYTIGGISQSATTTPGYTYKVTFDMSGNPDGVPTTKTLTVTSDYSNTATYTYNIGTNTHSAMQYASHSYYFTATGTSTVLSFATPDGSAWGPVLDNVAMSLVTQVCHLDNGKKGSKTLSPGLPAIAAHLAHGDPAGPCPQ